MIHLHMCATYTSRARVQWQLGVGAYLRLSTFKLITKGHPHYTIRSYTKHFRVSPPKTPSRLVVEVVGKEQNDSKTAEVTITAESALVVM